MARVQVIAEDGHVTLMERLDPKALHEEHFRACLAERIEWATMDAAEHDLADDRSDRD
jgi:hypothetical protein